MTEKLTGRQAIEALLAERSARYKEAEARCEALREELREATVERKNQGAWVESLILSLAEFPDAPKRGRKAATTNGTAPTRKPRRKPALGLTLTDLTDPPPA